jgi:1-acyl-sn-glycerol-3-phosphate acyltransferase
MKALLYDLLKAAVRLGFFFYFREIRMHGLEGVPRDRAVMLLPNHQNALIDPLLYAAFARGRRPYFLTRSDVFKSPVLKWLFSGLRMLPVYRLRDGRETLGHNQAVFEKCARLLGGGQHLLLFPEANHNMQRRVRPLSKGFTRILEQSFRVSPHLHILLVPVGVNYQQADGFPDRVAFYFGRPLDARDYWNQKDTRLEVPPLKAQVFDALTHLTTHIPEGEDPGWWEKKIQEKGVDWLLPAQVNALLGGTETAFSMQPGIPEFAGKIWDGFFRLLNAPVWVPWVWIREKRVPEPEFTSTFRFLFFLLAFPLYYLLLGLVLAFVLSVGWGVGAVAGLLLHNLVYVKLR